jgi:hypothetical protein
LIYDVMLRLTPDAYTSDLERGWSAELADPAWMLGRQWQMGEHQGEDASSPTTVTFTPADDRHRPPGRSGRIRPADHPGPGDRGIGAV